MKFLVYQTIRSKLIVEAESEEEVWDGEGKIVWENIVHGEIDSVEEYEGEAE
jgi:hypothetical protein